MRAFLPERGQREQEIERRLRIDRPGGIYARRSDPTAKDKNKDRSQSREMQTDDLIKWALQQGWTRQLLSEYFADLGLSGTLRPDQRPDMLRLFDDIDADKLDNGTVICFQENRLFRDETQIYYNQFIDKCLQHNIHVVVISPRLLIYDLRDELHKEMLRAKLKEAAEFIPRQIKGWLHPARERAAWVYGEWAGLGNLPPGFIVDYDQKSPSYKMAIPYWPHIEKTKEKFQLFMELGGDISLFYNRLRKSPIVYPEFESWVDKRSINAFKLSRYPGGGYYLKSKNSLVSLLTHPLHYGYRPVKDVIRRDDQGEKIREFEPVIELELLEFAYYRLAKTDFDGNPISTSKQRRYFQQGTDGLYGLLKFRILSNQGEVRTRSHGEYDEDIPPDTGVYLIETVEQSDYVHHPIVHTSIPCEELDAIIVKRLMEHVRSISQKRESVETYRQQVDTVRKKRQSRIKQLEGSIKDIEEEQKRLTARLGQRDEETSGEKNQEKSEEKKKPSPRVAELIFEQIDLLENERVTLIQTLAELEEEAEKDFGSLDEELEELKALWPEYTFEKRRTLINFIIREVVIDSMSTHWLKIQVLWLHEEWGREEMFYHRKKGKRKAWTTEEEEIIKEHYASMPGPKLMALLPDRTWQSIRTRGKMTLGIKRKTGRPTNNDDAVPDWATHCSYSDLVFMKEQNLEGTMQYTEWVRQYQLLRQT
jgi:hypothetical protein